MSSYANAPTKQARASTLAPPMTLDMHVALVVEDDRALQRVLRMMLEGNGFRVVIADSCHRGDLEARSHRPDIAIVDLGLPDLDGIELIKSLRTWSPIPIIVLSARSAEAQRLAAFEAGADDFVLKPYSGPELLARVHATLRRHVRGKQAAATLKLGDLIIDLSRRVVTTSAGIEIRFTPLEHRILETLARHAGQVVTHSQLMKEVWGPDRADTRSLRVFIATLRKKVEPDPAHPLYILNEPRLGYRLAIAPSTGERTTSGDKNPVD